MCNLSQQFPQTSAHFGHDKIRDKKTGKKHLASIPGKASCIIGGESQGIRISSRNNEGINTTNGNDGKFNRNPRIGFVSNFTLFLGIKTLHYFYSMRWCYKRKAAQQYMYCSTKTLFLN